MISITPYITNDRLSGDYQVKLMNLLQEDAALNASIPSAIRSSLDWLLRMVNSYYSNKIEGNSTHPKDLLQAQKYQNEYATAKLAKDIIEILAHQEAQFKLAAYATDSDQIWSEAFFKGIHKMFYSGVPDDMLLVKDVHGQVFLKEDGTPLKLIPGQYRDRDVKVGRHIPPKAEDISGYMSWIIRAYHPETLFATQSVLAAIAMHHRLAWVHPFIDGNGRAIRLLTDCYMKKLTGLSGYGLWSVTRGFALQTKEYYKALAEADKPRQGSTDGRGQLSDKGLMCFTEYFIDTALDQIRFFAGLYDAQKLNSRIDYYFAMRERNALPEDAAPIRPEARDIYKLLLKSGPMPRSAICKQIGKGEQTLRPVLKQMHEEGFISIKPKCDIKLKLSPMSVNMLFPSLLV
ncbi:Fic family protein [Endozoicomonas sp. ONNA2]|uniref:Fic family protein n=1 Tax=Endozoicomonas sp. ONNA2 TaxID=2828741 RepID=UPI002147C5C8|nr:Fic family protein [Endozoicomonas sp. ONNA2]